VYYVCLSQFVNGKLYISFPFLVHKINIKLKYAKRIETNQLLDRFSNGTVSENFPAYTRYSFSIVNVIGMWTASLLNLRRKNG